jgi:cardiolipin synthase
MKKENIFNIPNSITLTRLIAAPVLVYMILANFNSVAILIIFFIFGISDALDGFIARNFNQKTKFGAKFDMFADKIFFGGVVIALAVKFFIFEPTSFIFQHKEIFFLLLIREIVGFPATIYSLAKKQGAFVKVKISGKATTVMQVVTIIAILISFKYTIHLAYLTGAIGVISGIIYWRDILNFKKHGLK